VYGIRIAKSDLGYKSLGTSSENITEAAEPPRSNFRLPTMLEVIWARPSHVIHLLRTMASAAFYNAAKQ